MLNPKDKTIFNKKFILSIVWFIVASCIGTGLYYHDVLSQRKDLPVMASVPATVSPQIPSAHPENAYYDGKLDLNTATQEQLESLPGIGKVMAERIISYRCTQPFKQVRDLKKISGIGEKTFQNLIEYVCVVYND